MSDRQPTPGEIAVGAIVEALVIVIIFGGIILGAVVLFNSPNLLESKVVNCQVIDRDLVAVTLLAKKKTKEKPATLRTLYHRKGDPQWFEADGSQFNKKWSRIFGS